jgi:hypothetical protein
MTDSPRRGWRWAVVVAPGATALFYGVTSWAMSAGPHTVAAPAPQHTSPTAPVTGAANQPSAAASPAAVDAWLRTELATRRHLASQLRGELTALNGRLAAAKAHAATQQTVAAVPPPAVAAQAAPQSVAAPPVAAPPVAAPAPAAPPPPPPQQNAAPPPVHVVSGASGAPK